MDVVIKSGNSANTATINSDGEILVKPTSIKSKSGIVCGTSRFGDTSTLLTGKSGSDYYGNNSEYELDSNDDYSVRENIDYMFFQDTFIGSALNNNIWSSNTSGGAASVSVSGGYAVVLGSIGGASAFSVLQSYKFFPFLGSTTLSIVFRAKATGFNAPFKNTEFGYGILSGTNSIPTDGVFFRWGEDGDFRAIINNNGVEIKSSLIDYPITENNVFQYKINISQKSVEFYINKKIVAIIDRPPGQNSPQRSGAGCVFARTYNTAFVPHITSSISVSEVQVFSIGGDLKRDFAHERSSMGLNCNNGATGYSTLGTQSNISNSLALTSGTLTNTAAPTGGYTGTTLGGEFQFAAVSGTDTDLIIFGYQVPAASATTQAKNLVVTGLRIFTIGAGAAGDATTPTVIVWTLGYGSTAISLATTETAGAKAPRIIPLGSQTFNPSAAIGVSADPISTSLKTPVVVNPGQFLHIIAKIPIGVNTASRIFRGIVGIDGYWE